MPVCYCAVRAKVGRGYMGGRLKAVKCLRLGCVALLAMASAAPARATDLLPDLIVNPARLQDFSFSKSIVPGRVHIRFSNGTANVGLGPLFLFPGAATGGGQLVNQRIFASQGGFRDREAGIFLFHPTHNHFHFGSWAQYTIRAVLPGDAVGPVLRQGGKTSFCLLDSSRYLGPVPILGSVSSTRTFSTCNDDAQGVSVGWEDVYSRSLPDQWIDITGLTPGDYWLESVVDPGNRVEEVDENNNVGYFKITIAPGQLPVPDEIPVGRGFTPLPTLVLLLAAVGTLALRASIGGNRRL